LTKHQKIIRVSVRDFASPPRTSGDIDVRKDWAWSDAELGTQLHVEIQSRRRAEVPGWKAEVPVTLEIRDGAWTVAVSGRMDGLFDDGGEWCEEIKTTFSPRTQARLVVAQLEHPWRIQALLYALARQNATGAPVGARLIIVNAHTSHEQVVELGFPDDEFRDWVAARARQIVEGEKARRKFVKERAEIAENLVFPKQDLRPGQKQLIEAVEKACRNSARLLVQAPTGLGKSLGVIFPSLKSAMARGSKLLCLTPKNTQHASAEGAVKAIQERLGKKAPRLLTINARAKMCMKDAVYCQPEWCEYAKDHWGKVDRLKLLKKLEKTSTIDQTLLKSLARKHLVCPWVLGMQAAQRVDVVVSDYNYVLSPGSTLETSCYGSDLVRPPPHVVIDEAHNLPSRSMEWLSPRISLQSLAAATAGADLGARSICQRIESLLTEVCAEVSLPREQKLVDVSAEQKEIIEQVAKEIRLWLAESTEEHDRRTSEEPTESTSPPGQALRELFWQFLAISDLAPQLGSSILATICLKDGFAELSLHSCDASQLLREKYAKLGPMIAFSATLKPFDYHATLSGFSGAPYETLELVQPFSPENRKLILIPQISTRLNDRKAQIGRVTEVIVRTIELRVGNYMVFCPSFEFMNAVADATEKRLGELADRVDVIRQEPGGSGSRVTGIIEQLRTRARPVIVFAVSGGVLSEGVDLPGDQLIGAFVVGPPLPAASPIRQEFRKYWEKRNGDGFNFAFVYPAMAKAVQAAGRVIRTPDDRGVVVLMDERFAEPSYASCMPADWFKESPRELVPKSLTGSIKDFWNQV
jgi:DNA excision repair protein ERCC-2